MWCNKQLLVLVENLRGGDEKYRSIEKGGWNLNGLMLGTELVLNSELVRVLS